MMIWPPGCVKKNPQTGSWDATFWSWDSGPKECLEMASPARVLQRGKSGQARADMRWESRLQLPSPSGRGLIAGPLSLRERVTVRAVGNTQIRVRSWERGRYDLSPKTQHPRLGTHGCSPLSRGTASPTGNAIVTHTGDAQAAFSARFIFLTQLASPSRPILSLRLGNKPSLWVGLWYVRIGR
jgi:hypothetical protein